MSEDPPTRPDALPTGGEPEPAIPRLPDAAPIAARAAAVSPPVVGAGSTTTTAVVTGESPPPDAGSARRRTRSGGGVLVAVLVFLLVGAGLIAAGATGMFSSDSADTAEPPPTVGSGGVPAAGADDPAPARAETVVTVLGDGSETKAQPSPFLESLSAVDEAVVNRCDQQRRAIVIAAELYAVETGAVPTSQDDLVPGYLREVLVDWVVVPIDDGGAQLDAAGSGGCSGVPGVVQSTRLTAPGR